jgi:ribosome-associated protein
MIHAGPGISINEEELLFSFVRSGGPGGQNVNKVSTTAQLRFDVLRSPSLPDRVRQRLALLGGSRVTSGGVLVISASRFRTQERNRADAIERLVGLVQKAMQEPKKRKKTRPSFASKGRRIQHKKLLGEKKKNRRAGNWNIE